LPITRRLLLVVFGVWESVTSSRKSRAMAADEEELVLFGRRRPTQSTGHLSVSTRMPAEGDCAGGGEASRDLDDGRASRARSRQLPFRRTRCTAPDNLDKHVCFLDLVS
jgi:hypothetical protein